MDFSLDESQRMLLDSVERLLEQHGLRERTTAPSPAGWSRAVWDELCAIGVAGLPIGLADGGHGGSAVDVMLVMQAFGRALRVEPFLPSSVMAGRALGLGMRGPQRQKHLAEIATGRTLAAWAHAEPGARMAEDRVDTQAARHGTAWRLGGRKSHVLHGASADLLLVTARHGGPQAGLGLFAVDARAPGVTVHGLRRIDGIPVAEIVLQDVVVPDHDVLEGAPDVPALVREVEDAACAAAVAEGVGAMEFALRLTLEHIRTRRQFGVPIGSFQVLQHRAADMHVAIEQARSMAMYAAMSVDGADPRRRSAGVSAAKIVVDRAARLVGDSAIQLHGGMGMTDEHPIGHCARKLAALRSSFGDIDFHARRLARLGGALEEAT